MDAAAAELPTRWPALAAPVLEQIARAWTKPRMWSMLRGRPGSGVARAAGDERRQLVHQWRSADQGDHLGARRHAPRARSVSEKSSTALRSAIPRDPQDPLPLADVEIGARRRCSSGSSSFERLEKVPHPSQRPCRSRFGDREERGSRSRPRRQASARKARSGARRVNARATICSMISVKRRATRTEADEERMLEAGLLGEIRGRDDASDRGRAGAYLDGHAQTGRRRLGAPRAASAP